MLVFEGRVTVNGEMIAHPDERVAEEGTPFTVDGEAWVSRKRLVLALHKPVGYEVSRKPQHHQSVFSLLPTSFALRGVQPVGRLDTDTSGLILFTDAAALGPQRVRIVLTEGKYHQVKRMVAAAGNRVAGLHREAFGSLQLDESWPAGEWRLLDDATVATLSGR